MRSGRHPGTGVLLGGVVGVGVFVCDEVEEKELTGNGKSSSL